MISPTHMMFVGELLTNLSIKKEFDPSLNIGNGLILSDIFPLPSYDSDQPVTGMTGVNFTVSKDGNCYFRAIKPRSKKRLSADTKAFSIPRLGIEKAFFEAVKARAEFCGFKGVILESALTSPHPEALKAFARAKYPQVYSNFLDRLHQAQM